MRISKTEAATDITRNTLKEASEDQRFNWQDERDFDYAQRGLIARAPISDIRNSQGDVVWGVTAYDNFLGKERPDTIHPSLWRLEKLTVYNGVLLM